MDQPTRITEKSASCIDHIFTPMRNVTGFVLECDVSDHHAVGLLPDKITKLKKEEKKLTCLSRTNNLLIILNGIWNV
jgi:hypothetical protein